MNGLVDGAAATWTAALATIVVLGGMVGERRFFGWAQHLLAGLLTGYLVVLALRELIVPQVVAPLLAAPGERLDLWAGLAIVAAGATVAWAPRRIAALPVSLIVGGLAAFALGGAVVGILLPQAGATIVAPGAGADVAGGLLGLGITLLVALAFLHGTPQGRALAAGANVGRWLLVAGLGGWLGLLLVSRLAMLVDRIGFLAFDWLGLGR